ncbi:hypothetical protein BX616_010742 [Lobosporangium transversale]|uniref:F-box domain-containing protein n=1 Tax=Lobosporangium transversale TaxID=64571 RepID=A0A1Y2H1F3_9FUNG|nr:hypothetical protein BCR41DRAFT_346068 [Lobosporangium transversale]KAF9910977.1 hypothetical protein BX616_010742 [Lobosporangium transversale]ORZ27831.1 hypothetical protein BCR41DRAFT_346068 [Lobosporangium transversale]|eukprot:XP_021885534.1 hypothetical protein BCR41DRAFT_346068 [Lobosporangium transversale]
MPEDLLAGRFTSNTEDNLVNRLSSPSSAPLSIGSPSIPTSIRTVITSSYIYPTFRALEIPEILLHISSFLTLHDLNACTLVSSAWYAIFNSVLWQSITISESRHQPDFLKSLRKNLNLVHSLQWKYADWWELHHVTRVSQHDLSPSHFPSASLAPPVSIYRAFGPKVMMSTISGRLLNGSFTQPKSMSQTVAAAPIFLTNNMQSLSGPGRPIHQDPSVVSFPTTETLHQLCFENAFSLRTLVLDGPFELTLLLKTIQRSRIPLKHLSLKNTNYVKRETLLLDNLLGVSPNLEHCSIRTNAQIVLYTMPIPQSHVTGETNFQQQEPRQSRPPLKLKSLELDIRALTGVHLISILAQCPELESFAMTEYGQISPLRDIETHAFTIINDVSGQRKRPSSHADMLNYSADGNDSICKYLKDPVCQLPTFIHQGIESFQFGDAGLMALLQFCPRLTRLDLHQASSGKIYSKTLQAFLRSCIGLRHLRAHGVVLQVEDMVEDPLKGRKLQPWGCTGLETLSLAFGIAPGSQGEGNNTSSINNNNGNGYYNHAHTDVISSSDNHHSIAWAEQIVYSQLSLQTQLQVLDIRSPSFLRLQLGAGVEMLASLKRLREFSIAGSEVDGHKRLRTCESMNRWFEQHWPSINRIVIASQIHTFKKVVEGTADPFESFTTAIVNTTKQPQSMSASVSAAALLDITRIERRLSC